jgi:pSer/pThr/pTyr-binding forkhead associated (FHA) protein
MKKKPRIIVQLIHIDGPFKGQIQEFSNPEIVIGRHPSCQVQFPADYTAISRRHAKIIREGNRFKFIEQSKNGTYLNGKMVKEAILKNGDVLIFASGGPKVSFLTQVSDTPLEIEPEHKPVFTTPSFEEVANIKSVSDSEKMPYSKIKQKIEQKPIVQEKPIEIQAKKVKMPLSIVYGPKLQSFNELPICIGKSSDCDFVLVHPQIFDHHLRIFFQQDQYWVKDLTGKNLVLVDGKPIESQMPMTANCTLSLTPKGPEFKFLGQGRLLEIEPSQPSEDEADLQFQNDPDKDSPKSGKSSLIKKFWRR